MQKILMPLINIYGKAYHLTMTVLRQLSKFWFYVIVLCIRGFYEVHLTFWQQATNMNVPTSSESFVKIVWILKSSWFKLVKLSGTWWRPSFQSHCWDRLDFWQMQRIQIRKVGKYIKHLTVVDNIMLLRLS